MFKSIIVEGQTVQAEVVKAAPNSYFRIAPGKNPDVIQHVKHVGGNVYKVTERLVTKGGAESSRTRFVIVDPAAVWAEERRVEQQEFRRIVADYNNQFPRTDE